MPLGFTQAEYPGSSRPVRTFAQRLTAAASTDWTRFEDTNVTVALAGTATTATAIVERSAIEPLSPQDTTCAPAPADDTTFTGSLVTGLSPRVYIETGVGWWRVRMTVVTGGYVDAAVSGAGS